MLDEKGFDLWADGYDRSVQLSEESDEYPFSGYKNVLNAVYRAVHAQKQASVLDLGLEPARLRQSCMRRVMRSPASTFRRKCVRLRRKRCRVPG